MARLNLLMIAPPVIFAAIAGVFMLGLGRDDPNALPSAREGGAAPNLILEPLDGPVFDETNLAASGVKLVNFWASWCAPCRAEHVNLAKLAAEGLPIYGVNYKDQPDNALAFLDELGNPYAALGADPNARTALEWGVAGIPETFVIDGNGTVIFRFAGPITERSLLSVIRPALERAQGDAAN